MGSQTMTVYAIDEQRLVGLVDAGEGALPRVTDLVAGSGVEVDATRALALGRWDKDRVTDDAVSILNAFGVLLDRLCVAHVTLEMDDDPDDAPLLWDFVWGTTPGCARFRLPVPRHGAPCALFRSWSVTHTALERFKVARITGALQPHALSAAEHDRLLAILAQAVGSGLGVYVFRERGGRPRGVVRPVGEEPDPGYGWWFPLARTLRALMAMLAKELQTPRPASPTWHAWAADRLAQARPSVEEAVDEAAAQHARLVREPERNAAELAALEAAQRVIAGVRALLGQIEIAPGPLPGSWGESLSDADLVGGAGEVAQRSREAASAWEHAAIDSMRNALSASADAWEALTLGEPASGKRFATAAQWFALAWSAD